MKYLIVLALFLTGCYSSESCDPQWRDDLKYNDRVIISDGFFKGQAGLIKGQTHIYGSDQCNLEGFQIELESDKKVIGIEQALLVKKPLPAPVIRCQGYPFCEVEK